MKVPRLDLRRVNFTVNGRRILKSLSWTVWPEEHWAILGPNGAGKTTLLKIVCGYIWPNDGGEVYRNGKTDLDLGDLRRSIGWVTSTLVDEIPRRETVLDTVISGKYAQVGLWAFSWKRPSPGDTEKARRYLSEMGCESLADRQFGTLSQGEQQKILICRARMTEPYLTILDEPCAGMDPGAREVFLSSLRRVAGNPHHPSLIYVTHHVEEILPVFTKTLILKDGKILKAGNTKDVLTDQRISELYGISLQLVRKKGRYWPVPA
ncbi:MAG TPA: ABC transporter ATP-binding protein [Syntrophorhabdales bacterium]|nr:ABC transporter ATP-binding protein [Syntrophorhabdales bacterium]